MHGQTRGPIFKANLLASAAAACLMAGSASAQDATSTELAPIVIQGGSDTATSPVKGYVAKNSSTGSKSDTPLNEIPQSVSVIGTGEMDDRGITNKIDEVLLYTPGVTAQPYGGDGDTDWFYIRGFNATQTGVFFDNLTLFSYGFGGFQLDPFMLERVEVLKGPASVLYGGANPGGIVNLVRKRPLDEPLFYTDIGINSNGNAFTGFDVSDKVGSSGTMSYRITGKIAGGDNYSDFSEDLRGFIMPQLTISPDDSTSFTAWGYLAGLDQVHTGNGFFPYVGTVEDAPFGKIDRDAFYGEPGIDDGSYVQKMIGYEFEHEFDNGIKFSQNLRYGHLDKHEIGPYLNGWVGGVPTGPDYQLARIGFEGRSAVDSFGIDNRLEGEAELGGATHSMLVGLDYKYYRLDHVQKWPTWPTTATPISATDPIYGAIQPTNDVAIDQVVTQKQLGIYAQDQIHFGRGWLLTLNGRYDYVDTDADAVVGTSYTSNDSAVSGRIGLAYEFDNGLTPYVSAATFFNPLIGTGVSGALEPEEGEQFEGGIKYEPTFVDGSLTASFFHITKRNNTVTNPATFAQSQLGEVVSRGAELEGKVNINENWKILASLAYTDMEVTENEANPALVGNSPYLIPKVTASLWVDYTLTTGAFEGMSFGAGVRHQGWSWADEANTEKVPAATLVDAAIRYERENWGAALNVTNLFDKEYVKGCGGLTVCGYGDARTVTFKLSRKW
ncbi:TonB-dependent siderophore receptor [Rhizobium bangladeshense]|uniref:TonB-dependent siderophore receptor n=1 Tax=Rhizobium bangladeshense TaxID=1138189 RepID=A0ABS7LGB2_9HYPH|nr:TonB-dependent siderophore receptor [Rhizobium bangladeshense]MBX4875571.1 TonB-dependent siderophore receptor [Rhizobium bangladeshense]MBX4886587.1 TonB-dependent siderophore receptor [Rhizobium bangladeshense]MBY3590388.1 TonB-dependent siderophore receptor [Rhizobium bangladeshense]